ncbi:hypothetical protein Y032_0412g988 [Ancylostoma ceylanicum]|uniref:Uncharacterized protein n=1 Tax=Ancylostoma ceylanicum TaxID=53326 RepID=A0A016X2C3_9BILA|nr:hypothetical protein Y032_0412g988 [Ancylostoma ceylanicum]
MSTSAEEGTEMNFRLKRYYVEKWSENVYCCIRISICISIICVISYVLLFNLFFIECVVLFGCVYFML